MTPAKQTCLRTTGSFASHPEAGRHARNGCLFICIVQLVFHGSHAGTLDDFESEARRPMQSFKTPRENRQCDDFIDCFITEPFFDAILDHTVGAIGEDIDDLANNRQTLHNVYMTYDHQDVDNKIFANHYELNLELQKIGFNCKFSEFSESVPDDTLSLSRCHGLFLLLRGQGLGIALGIGTYRLEGNSEIRGLSTSLPVTLNYNSRLSFKFTYEQYETIESVNAQFFYGRKLRLVGGYKELAAGNVDLSGPYLGLAYKW